MIDLPEFVTHNVVTKDFTVQTSDLAHVGSFTVIVEATIEAPADYLNSSTDIFKAQASFVLTIDATCVTTRFVDWDLSG